MLHKVILFICMLFPLCIAGQQYNFRHYDVSDGLNHHMIFTIAQDSNGFIWMGTGNGINRFDGQSFVSYMPNHIILSIIVSPNGTIWAAIGAKPDGLYRYDENTDRFVCVPIDSVELEFDIIIDDKEETILMSSGNRLYSYDIHSGKTELRYETNKFEYIIDKCIIDDKIWFISGRDINCYDPILKTVESYDLFAHSPPTIQQVATRMIFDGKQQLWIGTRHNGLKIFDLKTKEYTDVPLGSSGSSPVSVRSILKITDKEFWIGTETGLMIYHPETKKTVTTTKRYANSFSLKDNNIYSLLADKEGGIWIGTYWRGIHYYHPSYSRFENYTADNTLYSVGGDVIKTITEDSEDNIWIATEDNGISKFNPTASLFEHFRPDGKEGELSSAKIQSLHAEGNHLWIGTFFNGINILDVRSGKVIKYLNSKNVPGVPLDRTTDIFKAKSGDLYLSSYSYGRVVKYNKKSDNFDVIRLDSTVGNIYNVAEDTKGTIWIASWKGIYTYDPATGSKQAHKYSVAFDTTSFLSGHISNVFIDKKERLWIGSHDMGLAILDKKTQNLLLINTDNGLPHHHIASIVEDNSGYFWISTLNGLVKMNSGGKIERIFHQADGLISGLFNEHSGFKAKDGTLYFGTKEGLLRFNPNSILHTTYNPSLHFTRLKINNELITALPEKGIIDEPIYKSNVIRLKYNQSEILIEFAALSYVNPELTQYSYMLEGFNTDWSPLRLSNQAHFTNLDPGKYTLKVRAYNKSFSGVPENSILIIIAPPFWQTWWAYTIYIITCICLIYFALRQYKRNINRKKEEELFQQQVEFYTNIAHEIKTPLTLIKGPLELIKEKKEVLPHIEQEIGIISRNEIILDNLVRQLLDFKKIETDHFQLQFQNLSLSNLLTQEFERFAVFARQRKLEYTIQLSDDNLSISGDADSLQKIFSNLLSNACKYAQQQIHITLSTEGKDVIIHFTSDGKTVPLEMQNKIFEPFVRMSENSYADGTGIGLYIARSLAQLHGGSLTLEITAEGYNDFVLIIPMEK